jgi:hypothetical protein
LIDERRARRVHVWRPHAIRASSTESRPAV